MINTTKRELAALLDGLRASGMPLVAERLEYLAKDVSAVASQGKTPDRSDQSS